MKILHIIHSVNPVGGGPIEGVKQLASASICLGAKIEVACLDAPDAPWLKDFPLPVHALGPSYFSYAYSPRFIPWLRKHARDYAYVVINGIWQYHSFATRCVLHKEGVPYFVFTHGMLDPWFKRHYPLKHLKKWLYWPWGEYRVLRDATAVLFTCLEEAIQARRSFWLYRWNERVVNYGTGGWKGDAEAQKRAFFARFPELEGRRLFLFLGRVHEKKGGDLLLRAFHGFLSTDPGSAFHLVMAGPADNAFGRELKRLAQKLGIEDQVTWTGMLEGDLKWGAFQAAEAFVLPSHQENFGISVAEALSASLPVLISDKVNIWREIDREHAGLVENDDLQGTMALLRRWGALSPEEQAAMRRQARHCFTRYFEIMAAAHSLLDIYSAVPAVPKAAALTAPQPLVSVLIPACNAGPFLRRALESLRAQTYSAWELIVVEDGSHDDTEAHVRAFAGSVSQSVRYENPGVRQGVSAARNRAMALARGEVFAFLDADDWWLPDHLASGLERLQKKADLCFSGFHVYDEPSQRERETLVPEVPPHPQEHLFRSNFIQTSSLVMVRRAAAEKAGGFDPALSVGEDCDYWMRILAAGGRLACTGAPTCFYVKHGGSAMTRTLLVAEHAVQFYRKHLGSPFFPASLRKTLYAASLANLGRLVRGGDPARARSLFLEAWRARPLDLRYPAYAVGTEVLARLRR
ncbi:MAG: glycosyltransferase [Verrucomicrobiota bacterium]